jgi:8-oxo-dGTP pyrophosphatase MutT (NUDIX family)
LNGDTEQVLAAVLVPLFRDPEGELRLVLTKRRSDLRRHAGEISFPGGRRDPSDSDLTETALREAEEEIGLPRADARVIATLTPTSTFATNYTIHPFVAMLAHDPGPRTWRASEREVETVLEPLLASLSSARGRTAISRRGFTFETDAYMFDEQIIWGATARIIDDLLARAPDLLEGYSGPLAKGTPTKLHHSVPEPS